MLASQSKVQLGGLSTKRTWQRSLNIDLSQQCCPTRLRSLQLRDKLQIPGGEFHLQHRLMQHLKFCPHTTRYSSWRTNTGSRCNLH